MSNRYSPDGVGSPAARGSKAPVETIDHLGPDEPCPGCGGRDFLVEEQGEAVIFRCIGCATAWRYELGFVWPVHTDHATADSESDPRP